MTPVGPTYEIWTLRRSWTQQANSAPSYLE